MPPPVQNRMELLMKIMSAGIHVFLVVFEQLLILLIIIILARSSAPAASPSWLWNAFSTRHLFPLLAAAMIAKEREKRSRLHHSCKDETSIALPYHSNGMEM
uniref:Uncharacterized protein n=1 Tax=Anopheles farauti TaxID=69004 RepID=A0A182QF37_9DIPT